MKRGRKFRVLIDRIPFAEGNIGEEAILASLLQDLRACDITDIAVLSNQPQRTRQRHGNGVHVIPDKPARWLALPFEVKKADLLIWGGGHMLQDRSSQLYIPYVIKTLLLAKLLGVPRFIYAPGLGPVVGKLGRFLSRMALSGARGLTVRDDVSAAYLRSIGLEGSFVQTADPAFSLKVNPRDLPRHTVAEGALVGFIPRRLFYRRGSWLPVSWQLASRRQQQNDRFAKFLRQTAAALDLLIEKKGVRLRLIPTDIGPNPRDDLICHQLRRLMVHAEAVEVLDDDPPLGEFVRRLGELDLLISARLHGIILGLRFGLPFIGIDSDGKIEQLAALLDCHNLVIKDAQCDQDRLYDLMQSTLAQSRDLRLDLTRRAATLRAKAEDNRRELLRCLKSIAKNDVRLPCTIQV